MGINHLTSGPLLVLMLAVFVGGEVQFLEKSKGGSVVLPCMHSGAGAPPISLTIKHLWRQQESEVMFMSAGYKAIPKGRYKGRLHASGNPGAGVVNVTIDHLEGADTGRYLCAFVVQSRGSDDAKVPGQNEFFLYVDDVDVAGLLDVRLLETSAGGSVTVPCLAPDGGPPSQGPPGAAEPGAAGGTCLKRWRGQGGAEVLFPSQHRAAGSASFGPERLRLDVAPGGRASGFTLLRLQQEDSAFYSCLLLVPHRPAHNATLGRSLFFVAVKKDDQCQCSDYATVLYATSGAVALLLILSIALACHACRSRPRDSVKPQALCPIYEEMVGVQQPLGKKLDETDTSGRGRHENPYDVPGSR